MNEISVVQKNDVIQREFNAVSLMPASFEGKFKMASILAKSGLIPQGLNTPEKVCVALEWGHELQLSPMVAVNNIAVINGKPTLSADIMAAVVKRSAEYGGIKWLTQNEKEAECEITRILPNGEKEITKSRFTMEDAVNANLAGRTVWKMYPKRMLKHRCLSYGLRDAFPDILAGLYSPEEMETITPETEKEPQFIPCETGTVEAEVVEQTDVRCQLEKLINKYGELLKKSSQKPTPYETAFAAVNNATDAEVENVYTRCVVWLGKQGINVEV